MERAKSISEPVKQTVPIVWHTLEKMEENVGFALTKLQYRKIRSCLNDLASFSHIAEVRTFLNTFSQQSVGEMLNSSKTKIAVNLSNREPSLGQIDALGRAISIGRRKNASAKVYMVSGTGECWVNGKPAIEYFKRQQEMFRLADPLEASRAFGKYNAWCLVKGGGYSGQSGALVQGLAKAMCLLSPKLQGVLKPFIYRDPRMVERKKPGQPKARKKFTWVKR